MKNLKQLEQEAQQARENLIATIELGAPASLLADDMILASVAMVTYQFALGMQEVSADGIGEALPEVSQEERNSDGWIEWHGGNCPIDSGAPTIVKFRDGNQSCVSHKAGSYEWRRDIVERDWDIVAYRIAK